MQENLNKIFVLYDYNYSFIIKVIDIKEDRIGYISSEYLDEIVEMYDSPYRTIPKEHFDRLLKYKKFKNRVIGIFEVTDYIIKSLNNGINVNFPFLEVKNNRITIADVTISKFRDYKLENILN